MHYQQGKDCGQFFLTSLESMVAADSWVRLVDAFVDAMPVLDLGFTHSKLNKEGNVPYHPSDLFKLLLYGYRHGIRSANKLHQATKINVEVMWLLKGLQPSARTINYFRTNNSSAIEQARRYFVRLLKEWQLVEGTTVTLDGTKIRGQNNLKRNFNAKKIERHLTYIEGKIEEYLQHWEELNTSKASTRKKKDKAKKIAKRLDQLRERREAYETLSDRLTSSSEDQISLTDPDARTVIKHRNIVEVGYNIQTVVDAKHSLVIDVFAGGVNDLYDLSPAAIRTQQILDKKYIDLIADAGYHNGVELAIAELRGVRPFVAPRQNKEQKEAGFRKSDFVFDRQHNRYICPAGEALHLVSIFKRGITKKPYTVKRYGADKCATCSLRQNCTRNKYGRFIERPIHQDYIDRNNARVARYKDFYRLRQQIIEHVFGTWKRHWGMDYTLLHGKQKVVSEYQLAAIAYNLKRSVSILGLDELKRRLKALILAIFGLFSSIVHHSTSQCENQIIQLRKTVAGRNLRRA